MLKSRMLAHVGACWRMLAYAGVDADSREEGQSVQQRRHEETKARLEETKARLEEQRNRHELELQQLRLRLAEASMPSPMLFACFTAVYRFTTALLLLYTALLLL